MNKARITFKGQVTIPKEIRKALTIQEGDTVTERSVDPEAWGRFLISVFDEWLRHDVGTVFVQTFDSALASWLHWREVGAPVNLAVADWQVARVWALTPKSSAASRRVNSFVPVVMFLAPCPKWPNRPLSIPNQSHSSRPSPPAYSAEVPVTFWLILSMY